VGACFDQLSVGIKDIGKLAPTKSTTMTVFIPSAFICVYLRFQKKQNGRGCTHIFDNHRAMIKNRTKTHAILVWGWFIEVICWWDKFG
jgi:hypothetical protein